MTDTKPHRTLSENFINQMNVLKAMTARSGMPADTKALQINEIAEISGVKDEKEIQRYLFILEGQKLVTPQPEGDFTSRNWAITRDGLRVVKRAASSSLL